MKKLLMSISTFSLALILTFSSFQLESASAISSENPGELIQPLAVPGEVRSCIGKFFSADGESYVNIQTNTGSVNRSLQWSFFINSSAYKLYSPQVKVMMTPVWVNGVYANSPYSPHTQSPSYNFHGSMKNYQVSGINKALKAGDRVKLFWRATNPSNSKNTTSVDFTCKVL